MELSKLLNLAGIQKTNDLEVINEEIESQLFDVKKDWISPGFTFRRFFSKINKLERIYHLQKYLNNSINSIQSSFSWPEVTGQITLDYPLLYSAKNKWSLSLQNESNAVQIINSIKDYDSILIQLAESWLGLVESNSINLNNVLYKDTMLSQQGDPTEIYKGLEKINEQNLKKKFNFVEWMEVEPNSPLLKEIVKAHKFLLAIDGRKVG